MGDYINYVSINKNKILLSIKQGKARCFIYFFFYLYSNSKLVNVINGQKKKNTLNLLIKVYSVKYH